MISILHVYGLKHFSFVCLGHVLKKAVSSCIPGELCKQNPPLGREEARSLCIVQEHIVHTK